MYSVLQLSLKEYEIKNTNSASSIHYKVKEFKVGEYIEIIKDTEIEAGGTITLVLPNDGVFTLDIFTDDEALANFTIHNITDLLSKKQHFLTQILTRPAPDRCNHNQYYDIISFSILLDSYNKLVKDSYTQANIPFEQLYKIEYLLNRLKEY